MDFYGAIDPPLAGDARIVAFVGTVPNERLVGVFDAPSGATDYGFLHIYGDDPKTDTLDEGADNAEVIKFAIGILRAISEDGSGTSFPGTPLFQTTITPVTPQFESNAVKNIDLIQQVSVDIPLPDGWSLISIPFDFLNKSVGNVFGALPAGVLEVVRGFVTSGPNPGAKTFVPNPPVGVVNDLTDILSTGGYWVRVNQETTLNVIGVPAPRDTQIGLSTPWNLISYLPEPPPPYDPAIDSADLEGLPAGPPGILDR